MTIKINVEDEDIPTEETQEDESINVVIKDEEKRFQSLKMNLEIRRSIDGSLMLFDHPEMDIAIVPASGKIIAFPRGAYTNEVYAAQNRLMEHLTKAGIIARESVQSGNVYGALEGKFLPLENSKLPVVDLSVLSLGQFIEKEKPEYIFQKHYDQEVEDMYVEPTDLDSTPLGKVPQSTKKGGIQGYDTRRYLSGI